MLTYEYKLDGTKDQYRAIDEAIQITQFVRNKCLAFWMNKGNVTHNDMHLYRPLLSREYPFVTRLNAQSQQCALERAWSAITRFYDNCKAHKPGKKGYPKFQHDNRSVGYKQNCWKLDPDGKHITFKDKCGIGRLRLVGTREIETFPVKQIKRVTIVKRADGYYCYFVVQAERRIEHIPTGKHVGIDMGLKEFLTDSEGNTVANPRFFSKAEKRMKTLNRRLSRKQKKSQNRGKARKQLAKAHLKVQRQREDFARKTANTLITSHDLIAYENLKIRNLMRNRKLSKSICDASWGKFLTWLKYYGTLHGIPVIAAEPSFTSQDCSACGTRVKKSLSVRTHICTGCGLVIDRDHNAAINILEKAYCTVGHTETGEAQALQNASGQTTSTSKPVKARGKRAGGKKNSHIVGSVNTILVYQVGG